MHSRISRFFRVCSVTALVVTMAQCSTAQEGQPAAPAGETEYLRAKPVAGTEIFPTPTAMNIPVDSAAINDAARFLAGLPAASGAGDTFDALRKSGTWKSHESRMNGLWRDFEARHGGPVDAWAKAEIGDLRSSPAVLYPFSGPDFLFSNLFFPKAETHVLCGLEACESLPDWNTLSPGQVAAGLQGLSSALNTILQLSYFITKDMRQDFQSTRFRGVLPVFLVFIARTGHVVESINAVRLDANGNPEIFAPGSGTVPGLLIRMNGPQGPKRLFYFSQDLSNNGLKPGAPFLRFAANLGKPVAFAKSASYLMHEAYFSTIRNHLLTECRGLVQDPSGVPYRHIQERGWKLDLYGNYKGTLALFSGSQQQDLIAAYQQQRPVRALSFGIGYLVNPASTCLMVGRPQ